MRTKIITLGLIAMMSTTACGSARADVAGTGQTTPSGQTYLATEIEQNGTTRRPVTGTRVELTFGADGKLDAFAGCNSISATVQTDGNRLTVGDLAITEMYCPAAAAQEEWFTAFLTASPAWHLDGDRLVLDHNGTTLRLLDRRIAAPDRPLTGTRWKLDIIATGPAGASADDATSAASAVPPAADAFLTITPDGALTGSTGCNNMSASVQINAEHLSVGAVATTRKGCPDDDVAAVEHAVLATLQQTVTYRIAGDDLTLTGPTGTALQMTATTP